MSADLEFKRVNIEDERADVKSFVLRVEMADIIQERAVSGLLG